MTKLKERPFAIIGVNTAGHAPKQLKEVMDKEQLAWTSFADPGEPGQGAIAAKWNVLSTPTIYVIDHKGVIKHKWVGGSGDKALDAALFKLVSEAERDGKDAPM